jgi:hypothetical protein
MDYSEPTTGTMNPNNDGLPVVVGVMNLLQLWQRKRHELKRKDSLHHWRKPRHR